jgi:hypothetical protein
VKWPDLDSYDIGVTRILAIFGPVPSGGDPTLPGIVLFVVGLLGFLYLPVQIGKIDSIRSQWTKIAFLVVIDSCFVMVGLVMLSRGLRR